MPLIRMNPDDHFRFMITVMLRALAVFPMTAILAPLLMAGKNAAGSGEQGYNAYEQDGVFHIEFLLLKR